MRFLAISGSARRLSTNTHLLHAMSRVAPTGIDIRVFDQIGDLPVFSPDLEGELTPPKVLKFIKAIDESDGLIISSPEYVRTLPGGLKNAIDWLVSRETIVGKPIVLTHASHRGDDMLTTLRTVLSTVSENFNADIFLRLPVMKEAPDSIAAVVELADHRRQVEEYLTAFAEFCRRCPRLI